MYYIWFGLPDIEIQLIGLEKTQTGRIPRKSCELSQSDKKSDLCNTFSLLPMNAMLFHKKISKSFRSTNNFQYYFIIEYVVMFSESINMLPWFWYAILEWEEVRETELKKMFKYCYASIFRISYPHWTDWVAWRNLYGSTFLWCFLRIVMHRLISWWSVTLYFNNKCGLTGIYIRRKIEIKIRNFLLCFPSIAMILVCISEFIFKQFYLICERTREDSAGDRRHRQLHTGRNKMRNGVCKM